MKSGVYKKTIRNKHLGSKSGSFMLIVGIILSFSLLLVGCGSTSSSELSGNGVSDNIIKGVASKGIISGGMVIIYAVNADGTLGAELGSAQTDAKGKYNINIGDHNRSAVIVVTGGRYTDEATGLTVDNTQLRAVIPEVNGTQEAAVTPLTEIAVQLAGGTYTLEKINNSNAAVSVLMGGANIIETLPPDINDGLANATDAEKDYTMFLASISQMVEDGSATDVDDAIALIMSDLEDDGELALDGSGVGDLLQGALGNFIDSPENQTGLILNDITLDEDMAAAADLENVKFVLTQIGADYDRDGVADERSFLTYDKCENVTVRDEDGDWWDDDYVDGTIDLRYTYTYDSEDRVTRMEQDWGADGSLSVIWAYSYTDGLLFTKEGIDPANNNVRNRITYTYDANDNMTIKFTDDFIANDQYQINYAYDANGNMINEQHDGGFNEAPDGTPNSQAFYTYDASGNRTVYGNDSDGDGVANYRTRYTHDADGNMLSSEFSEVVDGNEVITSIYTYAYDQSGNLVLREYDNGADGSIDATLTHKYVYDAFGHKIRDKFDSNGNGMIDEDISYTYEACTPPPPAPQPFYFSGTDGTNGGELWTTDGTDEGTFMVKDINAGVGDSFPDGFTEFGGKVYFTADDGVNGREIWVTDGTEAGTELAIEVDESTFTSYPRQFRVFQGKLYFSANDGVSGQVMWVSDGTDAGTQQMLNSDGGSVVSPWYLVTMGDKMFFESDTAPWGSELWVTDGTEAGTHILKDIDVNGDSSPTPLLVVGNKLYFKANDNVNGVNLWVTDGTADGTVMVKDIREGNFSDSITRFSHDGTGGLYFFADDGVHGCEVWKSDGTADGTVMVKDVNPDASTACSHIPRDLVAMNGKAYFFAEDGVNGKELWVTDGTEAGTTLLKDIYPGGTGQSVSSHWMTVLNGKAYFSADDGASGIELWVTDGTEAGTQMVKDATPGAAGSGFYGTSIYDDKMFYVLRAGTYGYEFWVTDGTVDGTHITKDINPGAADGYAEDE